MEKTARGEYGANPPTRTLFKARAPQRTTKTTYTSMNLNITRFTFP